ncbi:hypothetical protein [Niastella populi]|uniref:Cytochrome P460 domain-containing protein n=1 Tax=Niastella populi TaxID=550983 RepID=A0A1V9G1I5_9BACT|nr:hypothetical protein [Niastella populi]OQP64505.1 hypothetical protein A4R26_15740 [Niastella populi]
MRHTVYVFCLALVFLSGACHSKKTLGLNEEASLQNPGALPENPLLLNAITSSIYPKDSTIAVLYGNDLAYNYAAANADGHYPAGAVLYEVAWQLQTDEQWFGANIPKIIKTIERIEFSADNPPRYTLFHGDAHQEYAPLNKVERVAFILGQKMAVSP